MARLLIFAGLIAIAGGPACAQAQTQAAVTNPAWIAVHSPAYPELARAHYVATGFVRLRCTARTSGSVDACEVLEESPADQGFGEAALKVMPEARIRPRTEDGRPVDSRVVQSFRFALRDAPPGGDRVVEAAAEAVGRSDGPPSP